MPQSFYVRGQLLGTRPTPLVQIDHSDWVSPLSRALLCPHCGEIFARIEVSGAKWGVIIASCDGHGPLPETPIPGSILIPGFPELAGPDIPPTVLAYEFQQALRAYDMKEKND